MFTISLLFYLPHIHLTHSKSINLFLQDSTPTPLMSIQPHNHTDPSLITYYTLIFTTLLSLLPNSVTWVYSLLLFTINPLACYTRLLASLYLLSRVLPKLPALHDIYLLPSLLTHTLILSLTSFMVTFCQFYSYISYSYSPLSLFYLPT